MILTPDKVYCSYYLKVTFYQRTYQTLTISKCFLTVLTPNVWEHEQLLFLLMYMLLMRHKILLPDGNLNLKAVHTPVYSFGIVSQ